ncbi:protein kinase [Plakobranchus ocellatus]|uniref:Protein kinase n=1 Tax=Plakobranchus ocellatus TaxID=259542 RepID=A0AAV4DWZ4_9GAST|nr:protein kinase [Plakobranchus ocellatus]
MLPLMLDAGSEIAGAQALDETDSFHLIRSGTVTLKPIQGQGTVPVVTLKKNPFQYSPPSYGNSVKTVKVESQRAQVEAVLEMINKAKQDNTPRGLVLNQSVVTGKNSTKADEMVNVKKVLGSGNSAGDVVVVEDSGTGKDYAKKVIMLSQFNKDEILAWIHLSEAGKAPELYHFELKDNMVITSMEIMAGKTLQEIIDSGKLTDPLLARSFSLLVLRDLLTAFDCLKQGGFTHGDMHGGNVMVLPSMDIKLFDFGLARSMLLANMDHTQRLKADIVGILRMFCAAYTSGIDFEDYAAAQKALQSNKFREVSTVGSSMIDNMGPA